MTDVNIAMELLVDAQQDKFDTALLVSADSDLTGPILKVRNLFPNKAGRRRLSTQPRFGTVKREASGWIRIGKPPCGKTNSRPRRQTGWCGAEQTARMEIELHDR